MNKKKSGNLGLLNKNNFEEIFLQYFSPLVIYSIQMVGKHEVAEEIVQDQFTRLWEKRDELKITLSIKNYLYQSVKNSSLNYLKSVYSRDTVFDKELDLQISNFSDSLEQKELSDIINDLIDKLPEKTGIIFRMSRYGELTNKEISAELSIPVKTVEYHIKKALKYLRECIDRYYER